MIAYALIAEAAVALLWPTPKTNKKSVDLLEDSQPRQPERRGITYLDAVACLQKVSKRLEATEELDEDQREALEVITLALSRGSVSED